MDPYKILGVNQNSTPEEIKSAYRKLAAKHHPDRGGDTSTFQDIQRAYDILVDPAKKAEWEAQQNPHMRGFHGNGNPFQGNPFGQNGFNPLNEFFSQFFHTQQQRAYTIVVFVTLEQVANGGKHTIQFNTPNGNKFIEIEIPQGIQDGQQIRYEKLMPDGFLIVTYRIHKHARFERQGLDLSSNVEVNVFELITGTKLSIKDIYGATVEVNIPPMTKPNSKFRLPSKGLKGFGHVGDYYILIQANLPDKISQNLRSAIELEVNQTKS